MLSFISKIFDPLGLVGPILLQAKVLMQQVWLESLVKWDDVLPPNINEKWVEFAKGLIKMSSISIPRNINIKKPKRMELIGFADASIIAHGCCIYLRTIDQDNNIHTNLLCSKSRINPKNKILSVPRLELNSALLLASLANKVYQTLSLKYEVNTFLYLDSKIVLAWLDIEPVKLNAYVANRVDKIKQITYNFQWSYINTNDNPADCLSRGVDPQTLGTNMLWWYGPQFLNNADYIHCRFSDRDSIHNLPEVKQNKAVTCINTNHQNTFIPEFMDKGNNIDKMTRIMSYVLRFINNCRKKNTKLLDKLLLRIAVRTAVYYKT